MQLAASPSAHVIRPTDLSLDGVTELIRAALADPAPEFAAACHDATQGNPLLVRELVNSLADEAHRAHGRAGGRGARAGVALRRALGRGCGCGGLGTGSERLAQAVAVLGDGAELGTRGSPRRPRARSVPAAAAEALDPPDILAPELDRVRSPGGARGRVLAGSLPRIARERHREAASILSESGADEDEVALHLLAGRPAADPDGSSTSSAARRGGPTRAARRTSRPAICCGRCRSRLRQTAAAAPGGPGPSPSWPSSDMSGLARLREAVPLPDDPRRRARVTLTLGRALLDWVDYAGAARAVADALAELPDDEPELRARAGGPAHLSLLPRYGPPAGCRRAVLADLLEDSSDVSRSRVARDPVAAAMVISRLLRSEPISAHARWPTAG